MKQTEERSKALRQGKELFDNNLATVLQEIGLMGHIINESKY